MVLPYVPSVPPPPPPPPSGDLVQETDFNFLGSFALPANLDYASFISAYNAANNSIFVSVGSYITEIGIPALVASSNYNALNIGTTIQPLSSATEGLISNNPGQVSLNLGTVEIWGNRLVGTVWVPYDGAGEQTQSHFHRPINLSQSGDVQGLFALDTFDMPIAYASGNSFLIPPNYQPFFGNRAFVGSIWGGSIAGRMPNGHSFFAFNPSQFVSLPNKTPSACFGAHDNGFDHSLPFLMGEPVQGFVSPCWGPPSGARWDSQSQYWNDKTRRSFVIIKGSLVSFQSHGTGLHKYGAGTAASPADENCNIIPNIIYDPEDVGQGSHAYPYRYQVQCFDMNHLVEIYNGTRNRWNFTPYTQWTLNTPWPETHLQMGIAHDVANKKIYVANSVHWSNNGKTVINCYAYI
jgi:hypothetical protein